MIDRHRRRHRLRAAQGRRIVDALAEQLPRPARRPERRDGGPRIATHLADPAASEILVLDSPYVANWRLKADARGRLRVACTRLPSASPDPFQEQEDLQREGALTALIQNLADDAAKLSWIALIRHLRRRPKPERFPRTTRDA
ncbi:hypothetical protein AB0C33_14970 [Nonomuraea sp. NPDC048881]|uniref:hypothetical protein n=1 Tax=Nonomuraea sp. NPDC048881 TaxID=3155030 RepID=UPI0033D55AB3